jgi:purine-nucleoside phosphorylase
LIDFNFKYKKVLERINLEKPFKPVLSIVLGSGLGNFADKVNVIKSIPTSVIEDYPRSTVEGHKGFIHFAQFEIHLYEGYSISDSIIPVLISKEVGCKYILLTNAAGGIHPNLSPGSLMLIESVNGISIKKELTELLGLASIETKNRMLNFPSKSFNKIIEQSAIEIKFPLKHGTYWFSKGPTYETPAEIKMAERLGADSVGMSTVHEAIFAVKLGLEVSGISLISNWAAGISNTPLSHLEVVETANLVNEKFTELVKQIIKNII